MNSSEIESLVAGVDMKLALSLANAAVGKVPAPRITLAMVRLSRQLARIVRWSGSTVSLSPIYWAALRRDRRSFAESFYALFEQAESVIVAE